MITKDQIEQAIDALGNPEETQEQFDAWMDMDPDATMLMTDGIATTCLKNGIMEGSHPLDMLRAAVMMGFATCKKVMEEGE